MAKKKKRAAASQPDEAGASGEERRAAHEKLPFPHGVKLSGAGRNEAASPDGKTAESFSAESNPYHLKLQAVEDLVTANAENSPPVSKQELRKYHAGPKVKLADWIKAILLKFWFAGVICYFFVWGLSSFSMNSFDLLLILGVALGGVTHLLTNNIYRFMAKTEGAYDRWMMFPKDKIVFLPLNLLYALVLIFCTMMTYNGLNMTMGGGLGVEPLLFGIFVTLWDLLFLQMKQLGKRIVHDAKQKTI